MGREWASSPGILRDCQDLPPPRLKHRSGVFWLTGAREGYPSPCEYAGWGPDLAEGKGTPPQGGGSRRRGRRQPCQPAQAPGTPGGIGPPPPRPVGPGAKSGPRPAGRQAGTCRAGSGRAGPGGTQPQSGWAGPGPWGPRGRRPGLVGTSRPGAQARPGTWQIPGLLAPGAGPQDSAGPTPSCALIWASGRGSWRWCWWWGHRPASSPASRERQLVAMATRPRSASCIPLERANGTVPVPPVFTEPAGATGRTIAVGGGERRLVRPGWALRTQASVEVAHVQVPLAKAQKAGTQGGAHGPVGAE